MYVDRLVGQLMQRLRETKIGDRAVVVLTADHGIAFTPGQAVRGHRSARGPDVAVCRSCSGRRCS